MANPEVQIKALEKMLITVASSLKEVKDPSKLMEKAGALNEKSAAKLSQAIVEKENQKMMEQYNKENHKFNKQAADLTLPKSCLKRVLFQTKPES